MTWGAVGTAVVGGIMGSQAGGAARGQGAANQQAQLDWNKKVDPFSAGGSREQYVGQLNKLMQGGVTGISSDPTYQWMQQQGLQASERHASATGMAQSGNEQIALQQQGMGIANDYFQQQYARLAQLSGASGGGGQAATTGITPGNAYDMTMSQGANIGAAMQGLSGIFGSQPETTDPMAGTSGTMGNTTTAANWNPRVGQSVGGYTPQF